MYKRIININNTLQRKSVIILIQLIPILLNEVHRQIEENKNLRFILTGSNARKLKRKDGNLLGGRLSRYIFNTLVFPEYTSSDKAVSWEDTILFGAFLQY